MGILGKLVDIAVTANEEAHGYRLERELASTTEGLAQMTEERRTSAIVQFLVRRQEIVRKMGNWSVEGKLKTADRLKVEARKSYDFDLGGSYATWMASAWLESSVRTANASRIVHNKLEELARTCLADEKLARMVSGDAAQTRVQTRSLDAAVLEREVNSLFYVAAKGYFFDDILGYTEEGKVERAVSQARHGLERELLMALLLGIWGGVVARHEDGDVDDSVAAPLIARWFSGTSREVLEMIESVRKKTATAAIRETVFAAADAARDEPRANANLFDVVEQIRRRVSRD
jgi:hypothetical protein